MEANRSQSNVRLQLLLYAEQTALSAHNAKTRRKRSAPSWSSRTRSLAPSRHPARARERRCSTVCRICRLSSITQTFIWGDNPFYEACLKQAGL